MRRRLSFSIIPLLLLGLAVLQLAQGLEHDAGKGHLRSRRGSGHGTKIRDTKRQLAGLLPECELVQAGKCIAEN
jgi:hypothetical protein